MSLDTLSSKAPENPNFQELYNHFDAVPRRLGLIDENGDYHETRSENNPDLVLLLVGFGDLPDVRRMRGQYDEYIANEPEFEEFREMFYSAIPDEDVHRTIHRVGELRNITNDQLQEFMYRLSMSTRGFDIQDLLLGEQPEVSDGILFEMSDQNHLPPTMLDIADVALRGAGFAGIQGRPLSHSTDRYAKSLRMDLRQNIQQLLKAADIDPASLQAKGLYLGLNWPEPGKGTYKFKIIKFYPFAGVEEEEGLSVVRKKLVVPTTELWTPSAR